MFKLNRHKSDRLGERVEFRFSSFQAFQIPQGWDKLTLSLISVETGKTVTKSNKATVRSGTCQWTEAFTESIWIPTDVVSSEAEEYIYKIVVAVGSQRSGVLGELVVNLADYMTTEDSGSLSLPLRKCDYGTILQIRIQRINSKKGFRDAKSSKKASYSQSVRSNGDDVDNKSEGFDNVSSRTYPAERVNQDTSFSASGSYRSSDSGDGSSGKLSFSPRNNVNGGSYVRRQDSSGSHISATSSVGPADDVAKSDPSSFNSRASGSSTPKRQASSLRESASSISLLEAAEETIEELEDHVRMWERHAQKLKLDIEKYKKECSDKSKRQLELTSELSAACFERDSLKQEVEQLKLSFKGMNPGQISTRSPKGEDMLHAQKNFEDEVKLLKESNNNLSLQLSKSQEANLELVSILEELEETVERQKLEMADLQQRSPVGEHDDELSNQELLDVEWEAKLSAKEEQIRMLEKKLSVALNSEVPSESESGRSCADLIKEIDDLRNKVQELEKDCAELTEENLELVFKIQRSGTGNKGDNEAEDSDFGTDCLKAHIRRLQEEIRGKEALLGAQNDQTTVQMKNLETKCSDLEIELQQYKNQLHESQLEVDRKVSELSILQQKLETLHESDGTGKGLGNDSMIEELECTLSSKEKEIDVLTHAKEELEALISKMQTDKSQLQENLSNEQEDMALLATSVDSHNSTIKTLERKLIELEISKTELDIQASELEEENVQLSERILGLEAQLRYVIDERESARLELDDSKSLVVELEDEVVKQIAEKETQKGELREKLLGAQQKLSETQEETEYLKISHLKLQSTIESLIEENDSLQKSNADLRRQKLDLHEITAHLEIELHESQNKTTEFLQKVEFLESELSSLQNDIGLKEKQLTSQLESIFQEHGDQVERISQAKLMLSHIDRENIVEIENLKREIADLSSQLCATDEERERMGSDAVLEASSLRLDKAKLESSLKEVQGKLILYETEIQSLKQESGNKVQGLVDLLNASKQSEELLMSDIKNMQRQAETAKSSEEKSKKITTELELKLKTSEYEKQEITNETSSLKEQLQKMVHLQNEILVLKSSLEEAKFEKGKLEELLQSVTEECEALKTEKVSFVEKISSAQKALHDGEDERRSRIVLEDKLLRMAGDLSAKEALHTQEAELKNEINRIKRANSEYQRKIQCLEQEKGELLKKVQMLKINENQGEVVLDNDGSNKLYALQAMIRDLEAKIIILEKELAESLETNRILMEEKQIRDEQDTSKKTLQDCCRIASLEAELKGMQQASKMAALETELKEMRERYLHMSLQYAEVEAQREELVLKLKNSAPPKGGKSWFSRD